MRGPGAVTTNTGATCFMLDDQIKVVQEREDTFFPMLMHKSLEEGDTLWHDHCGIADLLVAI